MEASPAELAKEFCELCNWAHECWMTHRTLFDDNPDKEIISRKAPYFHEYLWRISHDYSLLQICKLHDPDQFNGSHNLSIKYMIHKLDWGNERDSVIQLADALNELYSRINIARNKIIAHNDLDILLGGEPIGDFREELDRDYFHCLHAFANRIREKWVGETYPPFKDMNFGAANALEYLDVLREADQADRLLNALSSRSHQDDDQVGK